MNLEIRRINEGDAEALWALRREALETEPASFAESFEEFCQIDPSGYRERLNLGVSNFIVGAFDGLALMAMAGFYRESREKRRHKGNIWGVYVAPDYRGKGVARLVLTHLLEAARELPGLECVLLTVTASHGTARRLYLSLGFLPFGVEPGGLKVNGRSFDEEHMLLKL
jgi:ribosomal protein S18 acetylase RimI-like enzyme